MRSRLERIRDWDRRAAAAGFSVGKLARSIRISRQHLNRYFQSHFGQSVLQWIRERRMKKAEALLQQGRSIKEIATELAYGYGRNFTHAFRRAYGKSPSQQSDFKRPAPRVSSRTGDKE